MHRATDGQFSFRQPETFRARQMPAGLFLFFQTIEYISIDKTPPDSIISTVYAHFTEPIPCRFLSAA